MLHWNMFLFAMMLAAAGIPLYIHLPRFASAELGLNLTAISAILIGVRIVDFVQDPLLGRMVDRWPGARGIFAVTSFTGLAAGFVMLFSMPPPISAEVWMLISLIVLFTSYSLATILMYGQSIAIATEGGGDRHFLIAGYRETGILVGVVGAAVAPSVLAHAAGGDSGYRGFGLLFAGLALTVLALTRRLWAVRHVPTKPLTLGALTASGGVALLALALVNALPVAITSTLFLFFVEDRLGLPSLSGMFLILFFVSAGASAPLWSRLVRHVGARRVLVPAMLLAIASFVCAAGLPNGAVVGFALVCAVSGAALGADMVILPALFSASLARNGLPAGQAFGIWAFVTKLSLALAAALVLPFLEMQGYAAGAANTPAALSALNLAYAIAPCLLKLVAVAMVLRLPIEVTQS